MEVKKSFSYYLKRFIFLFVGLMIMALGIAFSIKSAFGTSAISSLPYVESMILPLSVGTLTIILHCIFITLQIIILRRRYRPIQLLQLVVAIIFGYGTDFWLYVMQNVELTSYLSRGIFCAIGIVLVAIGVSMEVTAKLVPVAGEGLVLAISTAGNWEFGKVKRTFDITLVVMACIMSIVFLGSIKGVGIGTILSALLVGTLSGYILKPLAKFEEKHLA